MIDVRQEHWKGSALPSEPLAPARNRLVLVFGSVDRLKAPGLADEVARRFPQAIVAGCSTAGEITADGVADESITATVMTFEHTRLLHTSTVVSEMSRSRSAGIELAGRLAAPDLALVMVFSDGVHVNGSALVSGLTAGLGSQVAITGGLAGDAGKFQETIVFDGSTARERAVIAIGFYGDRLRAGHGSVGGWESFGPVRRVTRSKANVIHELDGKPALAIYESYLGDDAQNLPGSGLLFPLALVRNDQDTGLIRTLLAVDRERGTLTFAGDVPQGSLVRLMHADTDQLVAGSERASTTARDALADLAPQAALLVSCVGRRLLMGGLVDLEIEAASDVLGHAVGLTGFYSNGEISPLESTGASELHNQTMTVTTLAEVG